MRFRVRGFDGTNPQQSNLQDNQLEKTRSNAAIQIATADDNQRLGGTWICVLQSCLKIPPKGNDDVAKELGLCILYSYYLLAIRSIY